MNVPVFVFDQADTHRLIPARDADDTVLKRIARNRKDIEALIALDSATNERLAAEVNLLPGISVHELLFGVEYAHVVNAAFSHAHPHGSRFNSAERGAWYAGFELKTSQAEVAYHKALELQEIGWNEPETFEFNDYHADFHGAFHDLRGARGFRRYLMKGSDASSYAPSQALARELLAMGSSGIVYISVRAAKGTCLVSFRPALVTHVRLGHRYQLMFRTADAPPQWKLPRS